METACFSKKEVYKFPLCQKNLVIFFRNMKLAVLERYQEWEQTVTSAAYSDMLIDKVKPAIPNRRWELLSKTVRLLQVDAWPTSQPQKKTIRNLKSEYLPHLPYSSDLALCDFHVFGPLKRALRGAPI
jgi:hypothetical protein